MHSQLSVLAMEQLCHIKSISAKLNTFLDNYGEYAATVEAAELMLKGKEIVDSANIIAGCLNEIIISDVPVKDNKLDHKVCAFTGHRPSGFKFGYNEQDKECVRIKGELEKEIIKSIQDGYDYFVTGGAEGTDIWAAEIVLKLKNVYEYIKLEIAVPFPEQASKWSDGQKHRYGLILKHCDFVNVLSSTYTGNDVYHNRNKYMINKCSRLIAVYNGTPSGTASTVNYALKNKRSITLINPDTANITIL